jgi:hypothetical protein
MCDAGRTENECVRLESLTYDTIPGRRTHANQSTELRSPSVIRPGKAVIAVIPGFCDASNVKKRCPDRGISSRVLGVC